MIVLQAEGKEEGHHLIAMTGAPSARTSACLHMPQPAQPRPHPFAQPIAKLRGVVLQVANRDDLVLEL
jgi:hypothetical protein